MLIEITRTVRLGLFDAEVQSLKTGEIYRVAPAIGMVLVSEGWARAVGEETAGDVEAVDCAHDEADKEPAGS